MNPEISFNDCDFYNGYFYAASDKDNSFFRFNKDHFEKLFVFGDEEAAGCLFMQSIMVKDKIILTPSNARNIYTYDCPNDKLTKLCLNGSEAKKSKFHGILVNGNYAYFIPVAYPQMLRVNIDNNEIDYIDLKCDSPAELNYAQEINGSMISYKLYSKKIFEMNLHDNISLMQAKDISCNSIWGYYVYDGREFLVTDSGIQIISDNTLIFEDKKYELNRGIYLFTPYVYRDKIFFFPFSTGGHTSAVPVVIEKKSNNDYELRGLNGEIPTCFHCVKEYDGKLYMLRNSDCSVIIFDPERESFEVYIKGALKEFVQEGRSLGFEEWLNLQIL